MLRLPAAPALLAFLLVASGTASAAGQTPPADPAPPRLSLPQEFPQIEGYGSVVALPDAGERPRIGGRVVFDTTSAAPAPAGSRAKPRAAPRAAARTAAGLTAAPR